MVNSDTIAAISTPHGTGGIGIIRISGEDAFSIASKIFVGKKPFSMFKTHTIHHGWIMDPEKDHRMDEVLISKMEKPNTFTCEDVVEINCHGGTVILLKILELILHQGARIAEAGEFTKRAFLNGRLDLSQAEAVIDLICAKTEQSSRAAVLQLEGNLSKKIKESRSELVALLAHIAVTVDYPEHDVEEITANRVYEALGQIKIKLNKLVASFERGRIIREGIHAVIVGRPNVGKSSLMNELAGKTKAIVTDIPGTTRDVIEEYIHIGGIAVRLVDTAGMRVTEDLVEKMGVQKAENELYLADIVLLMMDASNKIEDEDMKILDRVGNKPLIIILNKIDLADENHLMKVQKQFLDKKIVRMSLKSDVGIEELENTLMSFFDNGEIDFEKEPILTNVRHKELMDQSIKSIQEGMDAYKNGMPLDCLSIDIKNAAEFLGSITGESVSEEVMHEIFSRFCLGK